MKLKRIHQIEDYINKHDTVSLKELSEEFNVSLNTIRRDINYLETNGAVNKIYGGVIATKGSELTTFDFRNTKNSSAKDAIAKRAAQEIENGDLVFIDSGTTTAPIINYLENDLKCTVLTNNLDVIIVASQKENIELIVLGSRYSHKTRSFLYTKQQNDHFEHYNITKAFMAATGVSIKNGLTNSDFHEYTVKNSVVNRAARSYILVDSSKIGKSALLTYADLNEIDTIITNEKLDNYNQTYIENNGISVLYS